MLLVHFADLKADMPGQIRRIADFLDIAVDEDRWPAILEHCSFDYMKRNAAKAAPLGGVFWDGGAETFINKGTNGRWRDVLTVADSARYERLALEKLGPDCAAGSRAARRSPAKPPNRDRAAGPCSRRRIQGDRALVAIEKESPWTTRIPAPVSAGRCRSK